MENEQAKLRQYLLGNLMIQEAEEIDLQILTDETLEEKLWWAESELAEDFLEGALSPQETKLFYDNFLISAERESHLKEIALLKKYAENSQITHKPVKKTSDAPDGLLPRLKNFFTLNLSPAAALFALLLICLTVGITWKFLLNGSNSETAQIEREYGEINRRDLSNLTDFQNVLNVSLFSGTFRDSNSANKLKLEKLTENVFFRLALPFETGEETFFNVQLLKDQNPVFTQNQIRVYKNQSGQEIRLILPKSIFQKGQYQIKIENPAVRDSSLNYNLTVE